MEELAWSLLHQVGHLLRRHLGVGEDGPRWNTAHDAEINDDLDGAPATAVTPDRLGLPSGLMAAEYHRLLDLIDVPPELEACAGAPFTGPAVMSALERDLLVRAVASRIRGEAPYGWRRWAESILRPQADWRVVLAALVRRSLAQASGRVDYSYRRPSRRDVQGVVLPSLVRPLPRVVVLVDTSGSVTEPALRRVLGEIDGILRACGTGQVEVVCCDAAAHPVQRVTRAADVELVGGGGTDLRAGFEAARALRPDVLIALTDGDTPWPERRPRAQVIVCLLEERPAPRGRACCGWRHDEERVGGVHAGGDAALAARGLRTRARLRVEGGRRGRSRRRQALAHGGGHARDRHHLAAGGDDAHRGGALARAGRGSARRGQEASVRRAAEEGVVVLQGPRRARWPDQAAPARGDPRRRRARVRRRRVGRAAGRAVGQAQDRPR
ncbi:vWA domain-containing protein [Nonomuraea recticatena]|uniref:vWA domain-containing protein n=1 Tax=Nonomuraea recticatena TaxID=46178 RepID=UPI00360A3C14